MKKFILGMATVLMMSGAAWAEGGELRALDLPGEPPGAGATREDPGDLGPPTGPINTPYYVPPGSGQLYWPDNAPHSMQYAPMPRERFPGDRPPRGWTPGY